jgi:hypothetical protein
MTTPTKSVKQVELLTASQIAQFKRDGYLVLPAVLDPDLCRQARDQMWETIAANLPRMKRDDPSTWTPITEEESSRPRVPPPVGVEDPYFAGRDHKLSVRNGTEQLILDLAPRALWQVAEQLLGAGTLVWPAGSDESGFNTGPCFMDDDIMGNLVNHMGAKAADLPEPSFTTEAMRLPATGPTWINGQGTRGLYCTLPQSPPHEAGYPSAHSDGACYGRVRLQLSAYIDDVGPNCGAFNVWPGSHARIWPEQWKAFKAGEKHTDKHLPVRMAGGYRDPVIGEIKADTEPVDGHGPAGTVVLWHTKILHIAGQNCSTDVIRQATIYGYLKSLEALPDALVVDDTDGDIWRDWSDEVRAISTCA